MKLARAVCPHCGLEMGVRPPEGMDIDGDVFPLHMPNIDVGYCPGSRMVVARESYV